jgi:ATP-binding cassette subfamily B protein
VTSSVRASAVTLVGAAISVGQTYLTTRLGNAVMRDLRDRLFSHLQRMDLAFFTRTRTGEIQSRLGNDVAGVQAVVTDTASSILGNTVTVISALVAMLVLSWRLTLVAGRAPAGVRPAAGAGRPGPAQGRRARRSAPSRT